MKKALILINVGTPVQANKKGVRKFLKPFLNDARVIDLPWLARKILVNFIIIPFRINKSTGLYKRLWTDEGSPILLHLEELARKIRLKLNDDTVVFTAMRYGEPSLKKVLAKTASENYSEITIFPLFPQYASSTTGTIFERIFSILKKQEVIPPLRLIDQYYDHPIFIDTYVKHIQDYRPEDYDHIVFSYHGLPLRQINKIHPDIKESVCSCEKELPAHGHHCYKAVCYENSRLLAEKLQLPNDAYSVGFQSRLSKNWLSPFTDKLLADLLRKGKKKILIAAPSFAADCLETTVEIDYEYKAEFEERGGEKLTLVKALNSSDEWAEAIKKIVFD
jgi:ferrochelatase